MQITSSLNEASRAVWDWVEVAEAAVEDVPDIFAWNTRDKVQMFFIFGGSGRVNAGLSFITAFLLDHSRFNTVCDRCTSRFFPFMSSLKPFSSDKDSSLRTVFHSLSSLSIDGSWYLKHSVLIFHLGWPADPGVSSAASTKLCWKGLERRSPYLEQERNMVKRVFF